MDLYKELIKKYPDRVERLEATLRAVYNVVWSQCSELLKNKLKENQQFEVMEDEGNVALLLMKICDAAHQKEEKVLVYDGIDELQRQFYNYRQMPGESNSTHTSLSFEK